MAVKTFGSPTTLKSVKALIDKKEDWQEELTQVAYGEIVGNLDNVSIRGLAFAPEMVAIYPSAGGTTTSGVYVFVAIFRKNADLKSAHYSRQGMYGVAGWKNGSAENSYPSYKDDMIFYEDGFTIPWVSLGISGLNDASFKYIAYKHAQ